MSRVDLEKPPCAEQISYSKISNRVELVDVEEDERRVL